MAHRDEEGDEVSSSKPVWRVPTDDESTVPSTVSNTLAELRAVAAAAAWPSRGLALRAARLAADGTFHPLLLRIGDNDQVIATLRLAAKCARIGGNASFADNCFKRLAAAERLRLINRSTREAVGA
jgi:hypothetical protein